MDITMTIGVFLRKALPKWWIIALCAAIGFGGAFYYTGTLVPRYYTETSLIGINFDKILVSGAVSMDDLTASRRIAVELIPVATSRRVASDVHSRLLDSGINLSVSQIQAMVSATVLPNTNMIKIKASSTDRSLVVPVANEVSDRFVDTLNSITGISYFSVLDKAEYAYSESGTSKRIIVAAGFLAGGIVGLVAVFLLVMLTRKIRMVEDLMNVKAVGNLALIPNHGIKY